MCVFDKFSLLFLMFYFVLNFAYVSTSILCFCLFGYRPRSRGRGQGGCGYPLYCIFSRFLVVYFGLVWFVQSFVALNWYILYLCSSLMFYLCFSFRFSLFRLFCCNCCCLFFFFLFFSLLLLLFNCCPWLLPLIIRLDSLRSRTLMRHSFL